MALLDVCINSKQNANAQCIMKRVCSGQKRLDDDVTLASSVAKFTRHTRTTGTKTHDQYKTAYR